MISPAGRTRRAFLAATFLRWLGPGLVNPVLVLLLADRGVDLAGIGVVFAVYGVTTTVAELPTGGLADALGRRPVLLVAALLFVVFDLGLVLGDGLAVFVCAAVAGGLGRALASGPLEAWYVDHARTLQPDFVLRPDLSRAGVAKGAALTVGALAAAAITGWAGNDGAAGIEVLALPVATAVAADLALAATVLTLIRQERRQHRRPTLRRAVRQVPWVVRDGGRLAWSTTMLRRVLATNAAIALAVVSVEMLWQPRLQELVAGTATAATFAGLIVAGFMLAATIGSALARRLPDRIAARPGPGAAAILVVVAVAILGLSLAGSPLGMALGLMVVFGMISTSGVLRRELLHEWVGPSRRATVVSVSSLAGQAGNIVASLVVAPIAMATSIPLAWTISAAVVILGAATIATTRLPGDPMSPATPE